jgi:PAS domain-containing protein
MAYNLRTESSISLSLLLTLQVITALCAIVLLSRMTPALEDILQENDFSIRAAEDMLAALASPSHDAARAAAFDDALSRARANITEDAERPLIDDLQRLAPASLRGDPNARAQALAALSALTSINRDSMRRADHNAQRLGRGGAWAAAALAIIASILGVLTMRRLNLRLVNPILNLHSVSRAFRDGDTSRRCHQHDTDAIIELSDIAQTLNTLLDATLNQRLSLSPSSPDAALRPALLFLLDRAPEPTCVLNAQAQVLAANPAALDLLSSALAGPLLSSFSSNPGLPTDLNGLSLSPSPIGSHPLWLCTLHVTLT